ncbi:hypothetical protein EXIGLDRAFT_576582, partial [Exidia glandulosa HHB12029]
ASYKLELSKELRRRRIHPVFHANLLRLHIPNDDERFPGRQWSQIAGLGENSKDRTVTEIVGYTKRGATFVFYVRWSDGFTTEETLENVKDLQAFSEFCDIMGFDAERKFKAREP